VRLSPAKFGQREERGVIGETKMDGGLKERLERKGIGKRGFKGKTATISAGDRGTAKIGKLEIRKGGELKRRDHLRVGAAPYRESEGKHA